jgi:hypothetical protein
MLICTGACEERITSAEQLIPEYRGVETELLDGDLVRFHVEMTNALVPANVSAYAECAAAGYTLVRGYGFARHVRTTVEEMNNVWKGDAVYTISASLPDGLVTLDAEVVAANCREKGIPLV